MVFLPSTCHCGFFRTKPQLAPPVDNFVDIVRNPLIIHSFAHCPHSYPQDEFQNFSDYLEKYPLT